MVGRRRIRGPSDPVAVEPVHEIGRPPRLEGDPGGNCDHTAAGDGI